MKSTAVATVLSLLSLVGVAILFFQVDELSESVRTLSRAGAGDVVPIAAPAKPSRGDRGARARVEDRARPNAETPPVEASDAPARPVGTVEERLARLEKAAHATRNAPSSSWRRPSFARNVNDLTTRLKLTPAQKDRVQSAVDRAKQRIQEVMKIPDADGKSPHERRAEQREKMMEALKGKDHAGVFSFATDAFGYRNRPIPGRNATYGQEIDRIKKEARQEIGSTLSAEQKETFDDMNIDPALGEGGAHFAAISVAPVIGGDGVVVETSLEGELEPPASPDDR